MFTKIIVVLFLTCLPLPALAADTFGNFEVGLPGITDPSIDNFVQNKPLVTFTNAAVKAVIAVLVIIGVICIVIGGYVYMTAGGDASRVKLGKEMIVAALAGIFLALISVVILNTINSYLGTDAVEPELDTSGAGGGAGGAGAGGGGAGGAGLGGGGVASLGAGDVGDDLPPPPPTLAELRDLQIEDTIKIADLNKQWQDHVAGRTLLTEAQINDNRATFNFLTNRLSSIQQQINALGG